MVTSNGLQAFTMEGLAKEAGVSAPLVYNYFDGRPQLLQELLAREYRLFVEETNQALQDAKSFEDIVRISVASNFDHHAPGNILPLLQSQPEIASVIRADQQRIRRRNAKFLVQSAAERYRLTTDQAQLAVSMSSGASIAAAELAANAKLDRTETIELAVSYILSGIEQIAGA
jgi:AcrR family transcriptional regulator